MKSYPAPLIEGPVVVTVISVDRQYGTHSRLLKPKVYYVLLMFLILEPLFYRERPAVAINDQGTESCDRGASIRTKLDGLASNDGGS